ncbi:hypothetical protein V1511DRAFT_455927 [Dipodascopsis uninucleata]
MSRNVGASQQPELPSDPPPPYSEIDSSGAYQTTGSSSTANQAPPMPPRPSQANANHQFNGPSIYQQTSSSGGYRPSQGGDQYTYAANGRLRYPPGYVCYKCGNTGYKTKHGRPCKSCFIRFSVPQSPIMPSPNMSAGFRRPMLGNLYAAPRADMPTVVAPGDPRLGGVLCSVCKGRGQVDDFGLSGLLSGLIGGMETCHVCRGIGRII